jgi:hypothetical protein
MTNYSINATLYPNSQYIAHGPFYIACNSCGAYEENTFTIVKSDSGASWCYRECLYTTTDTTITPSGLLSHVFDSISVVVSNDSNLMIRFNHNKIYNYSENPFSIDSIWYFKRYVNPCDGWNPAYIKDYTYFIKQRKLK